MAKVLKLTVAVLLVVGVAGVFVPVYAQSEKTEQYATASVSGEIVSVDSAKSEVIVKVLKDAVSKTYENKTISVLPETKITKSGSAVKLLNLKVGDKVIVKSTIDALGKQEVESISVETK